jgi:hypothetical protein
MLDPVRELKVRAQILHHAVKASESAALERLRVLVGFRKADAEALRSAATGIQRKHCLAAVSRELGFASFEHARRVFEGDASEADFGTLLYGTARGHLNHWFATYDQAHALHAQTSSATGRRYLLAYKRHFFVVDRLFIESVGLDPDDADWKEIGWDWARPKSREARRRLYGKFMDAQRSTAA